MKKRKWMKALALSMCLLILWWAMGAGATLAWFSDTDAVRNEFQVGLIDLEVRYKNDIVTQYELMEPDSEVFYDEALYEPGYTQVVYLQIDNKGDVDFKYKVSVTAENFQIAKNIWNENIYLSDHLKFGAVFGESEAAVREEVKDRLKSRTYAKDALGTWSQVSPYDFDAGEKPHYVALIIYMPEEVGNVANYRGANAPKVKLGITVFAQQKNAPIQ